MAMGGFQGPGKLLRDRSAGAVPSTSCHSLVSDLWNTPSLCLLAELQLFFWALIFGTIFWHLSFLSLLSLFF